MDCLSVGKSWRMDEPYIKVRGQWKYLYRVVDKQGQTVDFLVAALGLQIFHTAKETLTGLEFVHMVRKRQIRPLANGSNVDQLNALAT